MTSKMQRPSLTMTRWGFRRFDSLPTDEELENYYRDQYYQRGFGSYALQYSEEELRWKMLRERLVAEKATSLHPAARSMLDIGCGEGWMLAEFQARGFNVLGFDFSSEGVRKQHPALLPHLRQGNVMKLLEEIVEEEPRDIVSCINLLEHVRSPEGVLERLRSWMPVGSLLVATVPNDDSALHKHLLEQGITPTEWWVHYPDHISYFNKDGMINLMASMGFTVQAILADNPIDLNLLNGLCNYVVTPEVGQQVHRFRMLTDLFLAGIGLNKMLRLREAYADLGVGRNLTYFCRPNP